MQCLTLALCLSTAASASLLRRQVQCNDPTSGECWNNNLEVYEDQVCTPTNSTGDPDFNAPCNAVEVLTAECVYGTADLDSINSSLESGEDLSMLSNATQRICVCESQFFDQLQGCEACYTGHGFGEYIDITPSAISSLSAQYCAVTNTPTLGLAYVLFGIATDYQSGVLTKSSTSTVSTFSDPIGNKTDASYYFTPSVTGSAAYIVPAQTTSSASGSGSTTGSESAVSTSLSTSGGQIVPTASVSEASTASGSASGSAASASTTASGADRKQALAVVAVVAVAGFVAML
ncbi:hypothetical protein LTR08_000413 [Meristemomyces frigidus]|nr:hypothetical protein LTR08_000413 [Meristemomyces frigidus]